jgi:hypothetical protein
MGDLLATFLRILERHRLIDSEAAALIGVSPATVRYWRSTRTLPVRKRQLLALTAFIERNRSARSRGELRMGGIEHSGARRTIGSGT